MKENQETIKYYNEEEIKKLLKDKVKMVYVDTGYEEVVARYEDLPDVIVDINERFGSTDLKVYDFDKPDMDNPLLNTIGYFLDRCKPDVRKDIIDRLVGLQMGEIDIKDYKLIDEYTLDDVRKELETDKELER